MADRALRARSERVHARGAGNLSVSLARRIAAVTPRDAKGLPDPYCFFWGIGVTGCEPPVDFGPGVTPALLSVESVELPVAVESLFG